MNTAKGIQLFHADGRDSGIFYCSECRAVYATQQQADDCHGERLCACGKPRERFYPDCSECRGKRWAKDANERELARFDKAAKVASADYAGDHVFYGDKFYDSVEDALDSLEEGQEQPEYVWATRATSVRKATLQDITESIVENMWEDAEDSDLNGIDELSAAIDAFNEANKSIPMWEVDYRTAVLVNFAPPATP